MTELFQRVSTFHKEIIKKEDVAFDVVERVFTSIYWICKEEIPNRKILSILEMYENIGISEMKYFHHRSQRSLREMFLTLVDTLQSHILENVKSAE